VAELSPDLTWLQDTALTVVSVAATVSLVSVMLGLFSVITGKDHLPWRIRRLLRRVPASAEDHRLHGMGLMLNGAALMLVMLGVAAGAAGRHLGGFPSEAQFFVTIIAFLGSMALLAGAYTVSVRVRIVSTRASTDAHTGLPPV
jgi:hypothetical protein